MHLNVDADHFPTLEDGRWVTWDEVPRVNGKSKKVPYSPSSIPDRKASVNKPATWGTLAQALAAYQRPDVDGIGYVLTGCGIVGIDLDDCRDPETGVIARWAEDIVEWQDSYTEASPSGTGVHILLRADSLAGIGSNRRPVEVYTDRHYLTLTGHVLRDRAVMERTEAFHTWYQLHFNATSQTTSRVRSAGRSRPQPAPLRSRSPRAHAVGASNLDRAEQAVLRSTLKNPGFTRLWAGDATGYPSASEADAAFITHVARNGATEIQADHLMRGSGLYRRNGMPVVATPPTATAPLSRLLPGPRCGCGRSWT